MYEKIVCVAGFGDTASMYEPLLHTSLANEYELVLYNLPGFGAPSLSKETTIDRLADALAVYCKEQHARIVIAHSVASIITLEGAKKAASPIDLILSLEGNLTADDAYFSGSASNYEGPDSFRAAFLSRLRSLAQTQPVIERYLSVVAAADPQALWELGNDAFRYSQQCIPGDELISTVKAAYFYNPDNMSSSSLDWLSKKDIVTCKLKGASHWPTIDQPHILAAGLQEVISQLK